MDKIKKTISDWLYKLPIRVKLLIASGITFTLVLAASIHVFNIFIETTVKDQFTVSSKNTIHIIEQMLTADFDDEIIKELTQINFIEKVNITDSSGRLMYEWDSQDYHWDQLSYFSIKYPGDDAGKMSIAINHDKYMAKNIIEFSEYKNFILYITALLTLFIVLIVNLLIVTPVDKVSNVINQYIDEEYEEDEGDEKSKSKIIELSKTIGVLKRNIKQTKEKERQLVDTQKRLASVLNTVGDAIITINKEGNIVMVNPAFEKIWGYKKEDALGKSLEDMMPEKYREAHRAGMARYIDTGVENVINQNLELQALHADGTVFPIEIHISETRIDDVLYFTAAIKDITERKKTEKELLDAKENVEEMLELRTNDLVTRFNELNCLYGLYKLIESDSDNISHVLKETLSLITMACKHTDKACCMIHYDGHDYRTKNYKETEWCLEDDIRVKDKQKGYIRVCYLEKVNEDEQFLPYEKKLLNTICVRLSRHFEHGKAKEELVDANQALHETQLQLIQAEKLDTIGTLSAGVAHEVKNPLAVIQLGIDYLSRKSSGDENITEVIQEMEEAIGRADSVIKELVNFSASNDLSLEKLNVNQLIDDSLSLVKHEIIKNNVTISKSYFHNLIEISGDKPKLEQVLINLMINAIHAMESSGTKLIKIRTYPVRLGDIELDITGKFNIDDTIVAITIEDSGTGIAEEKMKKLFEPFFTTKQSGKGTGLGLTVCQNIVRLHGGTLKFENVKTGGAMATLLFKA